MSGHFQVIYLTIRKIDVPAVTVVFQTWQVGNSLMLREEPRLLKNIGQQRFDLYPFFWYWVKKLTLRSHPAVFFQPTTVDRHLLSQINNRVCRDTVISQKTLFRITQPRMPCISFLIPSISEAPIVSFTDLPNSVTSPKQHILCRHLHRAMSITPPPWRHCHKSSEAGPFITFTASIESIQLQTMVCTPLLPFLFDAILNTTTRLKPMPRIIGLENRTDIHSLHAGGYFP